MNLPECIAACLLRWERDTMMTSVDVRHKTWNIWFIRHHWFSVTRTNAVHVHVHAGFNQTQTQWSGNQFRCSLRLLWDYCCLHPPEPWTSEICSQTTRTLWWEMKLGRCEEENQTADCFSGLHKTQTHNRQIKGFVWLWNPAELHLWNKHRYGGRVLNGGKVRLCSRINLLPSLLCIRFHSANIPVWRLTLSVRPEIRSSERLIESYFTLPAVQ